MILHRLNGCAPTPLAHYLKALGILRLVAEQLDPEARGWWEGERFLLASRKDEDDLLKFFLDAYAPTPMLNPWGARSGFYPGSSETTSRLMVERIAVSDDPRFEPFRCAIRTTQSVLHETTGGRKPEDVDKQGKTNLVLALKSRLRTSSAAWLDAVVAVVDTSEKGLQQPALLGTGGSEGSGSYTAAFMKALCECLIDHQWDRSLRMVLFGEHDSGGQLWPGSFGQFLPDGLGSAWDLLFAFEGACVVRSSVVKRSESHGDRWLSSPFFVAPISAGFSSSSRLDEFALNKGKELPGRGEQWFPLWSSPTTLMEVENVFRQGRALVGRERPKTGFSMARAIAGIGVARGISEFVRYGYLQRNNAATHFAVPLGRFVVPDRTSPTLSCLDDLDAWLPRLRRAARDKNAPARLVQAERQLAGALFAVIQHPNESTRWQTVLLRLVDIEALQVHGAGVKAGPIPRLRPEWVQAADDGSAELRLALTLALQRSPEPLGKLQAGIRRHWLTLEKGRYTATPNPDRVMQGRSGADDAIALVSRRLIEAIQHGLRTLPLEPAHGCAASRHDLARLLAGEVDIDRCLALARALMALDARACVVQRPRLQAAPAADWPDDAWMVLRLALLPWPLPDGRHAGADPAIFRRLQAGDAASAISLAIRRLRAAGIPCTLRAAVAAPEIAQRYAAALAFPISRETAARFAERLAPIASKENAA